MKRINKIRNIGIIAHVDAGKTTVTERVLYYTGQTHKLGSVDDGNTVMDTDPQESKRGITIQSAAITTHWQYPNDKGIALNESKEYSINIIDTPGHVDFTAEVERSLRILDGVVALFCAKSGVEPQSETVWHQAEKYGLPKIAYINKMDRQGADFNRVLSEIKTNLGALPVPLQIPVGAGDDFEGVIDLITNRFLKWNASDQGITWIEEEIPGELLNDAMEQRSFLLEQIATQDESILNKYLSNVTIEQQELIGAIKSATLEGSILPVLCGAAYRNIGVQPLLDAVVQYLPSPEERGTIQTSSHQGEEAVELQPTVDETFAALVFKVVSDPYVGKMAMVRVYSGEISSGEYLLNVRTGKKVRVSRVLRILSNKFESTEHALAGEIYALVGIKDARTGDTLTLLGNSILLHSISFPEPVIGYAIEPKENKDEQSLGMALSKLQEEDPTLKVVSDRLTGQTVIRGMGELHLEVVLTKLKDAYYVDVNQGEPLITYKERLTQTTQYHQVFKKQNSGSGQFADISFEIGPRLDGEQGFEFVNDIKGGVIPKEFIPSIAKGFEEAMKSGGLAGYELMNLRIRLFDGKIHQQDSHAFDFEIAARDGFKNAYSFCEPVLMEPLMKVDILSPDVSVGTVTSDINRREGMIESIESKGVVQALKANIPLRRLFGYITSLRGLTAGRASASMSFSHFEVVSKAMTKEVLSSCEK